MLDLDYVTDTLQSYYGDKVLQLPGVVAEICRKGSRWRQEDFDRALAGHRESKQARYMPEFRSLAKHLPRGTVNPEDMTRDKLRLFCSAVDACGWVGAVRSIWDGSDCWQLRPMLRAAGIHRDTEPFGPPGVWPPYLLGYWTELLYGSNDPAIALHGLADAFDAMAPGMGDKPREQTERLAAMSLDARQSYFPCLRHLRQERRLAAEGRTADTYRPTTLKELCQAFTGKKHVNQAAPGVDLHEELRRQKAQLRADYIPAQQAQVEAYQPGDDDCPF